jgi:hypothetical protein
VLVALVLVARLAMVVTVKIVRVAHVIMVLLRPQVAIAVQIVEAIVMEIAVKNAP